MLVPMVTPHLLRLSRQWVTTFPPIMWTVQQHMSLEVR